ETSPVHRGPRAHRHRAHPRPREGVHRGLRARDQEGARAPRPPRAQPLLRGLHADPLELRARRQDAERRGDQLRVERVERREGRVAQGHGPDPLGLSPGPHRRANGARRRRPPDRGLDPGRRHQRGRRQARAPDPGAARRPHAARAARPARRREHLDRRRRPALAGRALQRPRLHEARREGHGLRAADAHPARLRVARLRGRVHARPAPGGRRRLRAADAERAHDGLLRALAARVRRRLPDRRPPARPAPGAHAPGAGQPRRRARRRGHRLPAGAHRPAGRRRRRRADGGALRAARRAHERRPHPLDPPVRM
ncbi:MAG: Aspartate carbamoyltransferase, partial [uncultured Solirubrobacteraceae bacterium]